LKLNIAHNYCLRCGS